MGGDVDAAVFVHHSAVELTYGFTVGDIYLEGLRAELGGSSLGVF